MTNVRLAYLKDVPDLNGCGTSLVDEMAQKSYILTFEKGATILKAGQPNQWIGIIQKGLVKAFEQMDNKEENFWAVFQEHQYCVCPFSLLSGQFSRTNLEAVEKTTIIAIDLNDFMTIRKEYPEFNSKVLQVLSNHMAYLMKEKSLMLNMTAIERYEYFLAQYPELAQRLPLGHVSIFLGIRQSSLSRIRRSLSQQVVVRQN